MQTGTSRSQWLRFPNRDRELEPRLPEDEWTLGVGIRTNLKVQKPQRMPNVSGTGNCEVLEDLRRQLRPFDTSRASQGTHCYLLSIPRYTKTLCSWPFPPTTKDPSILDLTCDLLQSFRLRPRGTNPPSTMDATQAPELPPGALTDDRRGTIVGVVIFLCLWSTLMVALRFWTRGVIIKQLGIDDYLCAIGLVCAQ